MENRLKYEDIKDYDNLKIYDTKVGLLSSSIRKAKKDLKEARDKKQSNNSIKNLEDDVEKKKQKLEKYMKDISENIQVSTSESTLFPPVSKEDYELS